MGDVYPHDYIIVNGKKTKPPAYYDNILKTERPYEFDHIKETRELRANEQENAFVIKNGYSNNSQKRLQVREKCLKENVLNKLPRNLT